VKTLSDKLSFMDGDGDSVAAPSVTPAPVEAPAFTPEPQPQPQIPEPVAPSVEAPIAPAAPQSLQVPPGYIPIAAQLDEREKRKAAEERALALERQIQEFQSRQQPSPDLFEDPEGFRNRIAQENEHQRWIDRTNMSELIASQQFGAETVNKAIEAFQRECPPGSPRAMELRQQAHPVGYVVEWHRQQEKLKAIGNDDLDAFVKRRAAELGLIPGQLQANPQQHLTAQPAPAPIIPATIATAPSAGGMAPPVSTGPGVAFEAVFKR
jgi:hypothetical protein